VNSLTGGTTGRLVPHNAAPIDQGHAVEVTPSFLHHPFFHCSMHFNQHRVKAHRVQFQQGSG